MPWYPSVKQEIIRTTSEHLGVTTWCTLACAVDEDKHIPIAAAGLGLLVAVAGVGLWPCSGGWLWLVVSLAAGVLLPASTLPAINLWLVPLPVSPGLRPLPSRSAVEQPDDVVGRL